MRQRLSALSYDALASLIVGAAMAPAPWPLWRHPQGRNVTFRASDGMTLRGWLFEPSQPTATLVLGHGYREHRRQLTFLASHFMMRGLRVLAFDFRAHGESAGRQITFGLNEAQDVNGALTRARAFGDPVVYLGFSMGAAAYLLSGTEADAAVLDSPYDTLTRTVTLRLRKARWPMILDPLVFERGAIRLGADVNTVRPVDAVLGLKRPSLFVFASEDGWIPEENREAFRQALSTSGQIVTLDQGGHADHFTAPWLHQITSFVMDAVRVRP